jgi:hypothetical protein
MTSPQLIRSEGRVQIWSLLGSDDTRRIEALLELYARLFPQYAHYVPRMRRRAAYGAEHRYGQIVHYWLVEVDGQPAGFRTFRYLARRHVGLAHSLGVDPAYREVSVGGQRLSMFLVRACLEQIIADARQLRDGPCLGMVNEVESPRLMKHYEQNGIICMPVDYAEPVFPPEQPGRSRAEELALTRFSPMYLGFLPAPGYEDLAYTGELMTGFAMGFLVDHYGLPEDHPQVQAMLDSVSVFS